MDCSLQLRDPRIPLSPKYPEEINAAGLPRTPARLGWLRTLCSFILLEVAHFWFWTAHQVCFLTHVRPHFMCGDNTCAACRTYRLPLPLQPCSISVSILPVSWSFATQACSFPRSQIQESVTTSPGSVSQSGNTAAA